MCVWSVGVCYWHCYGVCMRICVSMFVCVRLRYVCVCVRSAVWAPVFQLSACGLCTCGLWVWLIVGGWVGVLVFVALAISGLMTFTLGEEPGMVIGEWVNGWVSGWLKWWVSGCVSKWMSEWVVNGWMCGCMGKWVGDFECCYVFWEIFVDVWDVL